MSPPSLAELVGSVRLHPRIAYQGLYADEVDREALLEIVPPLVPFQGTYVGGTALLDWDHRLPSQQILLRLYLYCTPEALTAGRRAFDDRLEEIGNRDRFPEFNVPDFSELPADEAYDVELDSAGNLLRCRLVSPWRRSVPLEAGERAVAAARASDEYRRLAQSGDRPRQLGELEAVSWVPPCESGTSAWTLDVWYLLAFDGRVGTGRSMLVDPTPNVVVAVRDFSIRTG